MIAVNTTEGAVLVLISGNRVSQEYLRNMSVRYAALDGRILDNFDDDAEDIAAIYPWMSQSWDSLFDSTAVRIFRRLNGHLLTLLQTPFDEETQERVRHYVTTAAARGQRVRQDQCGPVSYCSLGALLGNAQQGRVLRRAPQL